MNMQKGIPALLLGLFLLFCFSLSMAEETEVEPGVFHGYERAARGIHHTVYPEIVDFRIDEAGTMLSVGDTVHFHFRVTTGDGASISSRYLYFGANSADDEYVSLSLDEETGEYTGSYTFTKSDPSGEYYVTSCYFSDSYSFYTQYSGSKRIVKRLLPYSVYLQNPDLPEEEDAEQITNFVFEENNKTLMPGDKLHLSFDLPANFDLSSFNIYIYRQGGGTSFSIYSWQLNREDSAGTYIYDKETGHLTCEYTLDDTRTDGKYYLSSINCNGTDGNCRKDLGYMRYTFSLTGAQPEAEAAVITVSDVESPCDGKTLTDGDSFTLSFKAESTREITSASVTLDYFQAYDYSRGNGISRRNGWEIRTDAVLDEETGLYRVEYPLKEEDLYGMYTVTLSLNAEDSYKSYETGIMFLFAESREETFKRLDPATDLNWTEDGYCRFSIPEDHQDRVNISVYRENGDHMTGVTYHGIGNGEWFAESGVDVLYDVSDLETGKYYFTVTLLGDGKEYYDSRIAQSDLFSFTAPDKKLETVSEIVWVDTDHEWGYYKAAQAYVPGDTTYVDHLEYSWYFSETENGTPESCGWRSWGDFDTETGCGDDSIFDDLLQEYGSGYYFCSVQAITSNIFQCANSDLSEMSPGQYFGAEDQESSVKDLLNAVITMGKTPDEVRAQVQAIDTADLKEAILADDSVVDKLRELEVRIGAVTEVVVTENAPAVCAGVVVTGAGLNTLTGENPKLVVDKPKAEDVLPAAYNNSIAVRFSMELQNVENPEDLKVPVLIDIPVPAWINPAFLEIFHYPLDGGEPEIILPFIYTAGDRAYAQFALTGFSDFVMTMQVPQGSTLILPAGVTQVEDEAFSGNAACIIIVPEGCKSIGSKAFSNSNNLTEIRLPASLETIAADAFEGCQGFSIITESEVVLAMPEFADRIVK